MLISIQKPKYALISSAFVSHSGTGPSPLLDVARQAAAYLLVSVTIWPIRSGVKKVRNISVGSDERDTVGPVGLVNGSTVTSLSVLSHSLSVVGSLQEL